MIPRGDESGNVPQTLRFGRREIDTSHFPQLVENHLEKVSNTEDLEEIGVKLIAKDFPEEDLEAFIRRVCQWGGYAGIAGRIIKNNSPEDLRSHFRAAANLLDEGDIAGAMAELNEVSDLGGISFASKHLRFLRPDLCPVLDSILANTLGYDLDSDGYESFCQDCADAADQLDDAEIINPRGGSWRPADVEAGVFAEVRGWTDGIIPDEEDEGDEASDMLEQGSPEETDTEDESEGSDEVDEEIETVPSDGEYELEHEVEDSPVIPTTWDPRVPESANNSGPGHV